jgi:DNA mismatch repair ATPase MutS
VTHDMNSLIRVQHATPASVVVLDELGRGTSTFDGYAIACAVLQHLSAQVQLDAHWSLPLPGRHTWCIIGSL